jgi:hypothetical protein
MVEFPSEAAMRPQQETNPNLAAARVRRQSLRAVMGVLEAALASPAVGRTPEWTRGVDAALAQLDVCVTEHIAATEGPAGFHTEIVTAAPRLHHDVKVLVVDHRRIVELIEQLRLAANHARTDGQVRGIREHGTAVLALLAKHRQRGADLIYEAYQCDLGGDG